MGGPRVGSNSRHDKFEIRGEGKPCENVITREKAERFLKLKEIKE